MCVSASKRKEKKEFDPGSQVFKVITVLVLCSLNAGQNVYLAHGGTSCIYDFKSLITV